MDPSTHAFTFPTDLAGNPVDRSFLVATQGFADLNLVQPDYVVPNGFVFIPNGRLQLVGTIADFSYEGLPIDGVNAIWGDGDGGPNAIGPAVAVNFAGQSYSFGPGSPPPSPPPPRPPPPGAATVPVIEYYYAEFGHYFITARADEITALDNGTFPGWVRTGLQFNAYDDSTSAITSPIRRFFSTAFAPKSSHFYTPFAFECAVVRTYREWSLESAAAFEIALPTADGSCFAGLTPVYRLYNNGQGGAPNHRYTTDFTVRAQMIAQGWVLEGLGPNAVQMCSPP